MIHFGGKTVINGNQSVLFIATPPQDIVSPNPPYFADISMGAKCKAPTTFYGNDCSRVVDGNENTDYYAGSCYHSEMDLKNPWLQVDLGKKSQVDMITIVNRYRDLAS